MTDRLWVWSLPTVAILLTESIQDTSPRIHSESRLRTGEIKNLYPMKLAERIYPWG